MDKFFMALLFWGICLSDIYGAEAYSENSVLKYEYEYVRIKEHVNYIPCEKY